MGSVGAPEVLVILVLALIVLGPERLPQAARTLGRWVGELRRLTGSLQAEVQGVVDEVMRPVNETATVATGAFTSNFTAGETGLVDSDGAATTASPSAATAEPASGSAPAAPLAADVPLPGLEPGHSFPVPPADPSLN